MTLTEASVTDRQEHCSDDSFAQPAASTRFLELLGLCKSYLLASGERHEVLRDVSLTVERGELVAIVGFSGAGKTTMISLIAGLLRPDGGRVLIGGREVSGPGPDRGVMFQSYALLPWLSVEGNVALAVDQVFPEWSAQRRREWIDRHLELVGLTAARKKKPGQLSGGMRQRVALARALAMDPELLLLDEPLSALDALTRATLQGEIERIFRESRKTVVLVTNDVDEALLLADRVVPLGAGPGATLGASIRVPFARPRRARELGHDVQFLALRAQVIDALLASRRPPCAVAALQNEPAAVLVEA
jgi:nitrate/nitrite transport system ATP-binding protein